jgi:hypothetical protein
MQDDAIDPDRLAATADGGFHASGLKPDQLAWGVPAPERSYWPARAAVVAAILLNLMLPERLVAGPRWVVPALEAVVLLVLSSLTPHRTTEQSPHRRVLAILMVGMVSAANLSNLILLVRLLIGGHVQDGRELIFAAIAIWLTNVIVFALWYWELDRGGPPARHDPQHREPDFLFPQMTTPGSSRPTWAPGFVDYAYVSFTNATAFSPTDTMPLTPTAKALMTVQSASALLTVALVAARAVNILN